MPRGSNRAAQMPKPLCEYFSVKHHAPPLSLIVTLYFRSGDHRAGENPRCCGIRCQSDGRSTLPLAGSPEPWVVLSLGRQIVESVRRAEIERRAAEPADEGAAVPVEVPLIVPMAPTRHAPAEVPAPEAPAPDIPAPDICKSGEIGLDFKTEADSMSLSHERMESPASDAWRAPRPLSRRAPVSARIPSRRSCSAPWPTVRCRRAKSKAWPPVRASSQPERQSVMPRSVQTLASEHITKAMRIFRTDAAACAVT
jgi:hypothetical protein